MLVRFIENNSHIWDSKLVYELVLSFKWTVQLVKVCVPCVPLFTNLCAPLKAWIVTSESCRNLASKLLAQLDFIQVLEFVGRLSVDKSACLSLFAFGVSLEVSPGHFVAG